MNLPIINALARTAKQTRSQETAKEKKGRFGLVFNKFCEGLDFSSEMLICGWHQVSQVQEPTWGACLFKSERPTRWETVGSRITDWEGEKDVRVVGEGLFVL